MYSIVGVLVVLFYNNDLRQVSSLDPVSTRVLGNVKIIVNTYSNKATGHDFLKPLSQHYCFHTSPNA